MTRVETCPSTVPQAMKRYVYRRIFRQLTVHCIGNQISCSRRNKANSDTPLSVPLHRFLSNDTTSYSKRVRPHYLAKTVTNGIYRCSKIRTTASTSKIRQAKYRAKKSKKSSESLESLEQARGSNNSKPRQHAEGNSRPTQHVTHGVTTKRDVTIAQNQT